MDTECALGVERARHLTSLTREWGTWETVSLYLDRCQVDTPDELVVATWKHVELLRTHVGKVVDFGAGDGRFARHGHFSDYFGYEIDRDRCQNAVLPDHASLINRCAFSDQINDADLCIGNPPFVRNQDLPEGWRLKASEILYRRTGIAVSGLANAWQYFFLLSLASLKPSGLCALVIPYEWVSRPSAKVLRDYIIEQKWNVNVYRLMDTTFASVLTTSSITIVDKKMREGKWSYFEESAEGNYLPLSSPSGASEGVIGYLRRSEVTRQVGPRAIRGLSPGTQKVLTLTEGERVRSGLQVDRDVVPCITSLRPLPTDVKTLNNAAFRDYYRSTGQKCWLIRTDTLPSQELRSYLDAVPALDYQTSTCLERDEWWKFKMPPTPELLMSMSFKGKFPKVVSNDLAARAVGGVCGIYNVNEAQAMRLVGGFDGIDISNRVVAYSNGLRKIEINQINMLFATSFGVDTAVV